MEKFKSLSVHDFVEMNFDMTIHSYLYDKEIEEKKRIFRNSNSFADFHSESEQFKKQAIVDWRVAYHESLKLTFNNYPSDYFAMYFELGDGYCMHSNFKERIVEGNSIHMVFCRDFNEKNYGLMTKNSEQHSFVVVYSSEEFRGLAERYPEVLEEPYRRFERGESFFLQGTQHQLTAEMRLIIAQIKQAQLFGSVREPYVEAKTMELLALQFDALKPPRIKCCKRKVDQRKIYQAQEILLSDIHYMPTISSLAKEVGVNEMKLKQGFKELLGQGVHEYIVNNRLMYARQLLLDTEKSISEIAMLCGYSYPSHFSTAFKRRFGVAPVSLRGK